jgi:acyl-CoA reductase-like NAD-dependent aldehyde dehydrogenase
MKEELQSRIFEATKDMTREERDAYREQQAERFRRRLEHLAPAIAAEQR